MRVRRISEYQEKETVEMVLPAFFYHLTRINSGVVLKNYGKILINTTIHCGDNVKVKNNKTISMVSK